MIDYFRLFGEETDSRTLGILFISILMDDDLCVCFTHLQGNFVNLGYIFWNIHQAFYNNVCAKFGVDTSNKEDLQTS